MTRKPSDADRRELAVHWTEGPVLVEAGAGTGKTRLLVDRVVHLIREEKARIEEIAAITFTVKAAAELRERIRAALLREQAAGGPALRDALRDIERAPISTIHGFALSLLRERPLDAGLPPEIAEVDPVASDSLRDQAWEAWLQEKFATDDPALADFFSLGFTIRGHLTTVRDVLLNAPELRSDFPEPRGLTPEAAIEEVRNLYRECADFAHAHCLDRTDKAFAQLDAFERWAEGLSGLTLPGLMRALWDMPPFRRNVGSAKKWDAGKLQEIREKFTQLRAAATSGVSHEILARVIASLREFAEVYEARMREAGLMDYQDILFQAVKMIRERPAARSHFRSRFRHFLVDEFQDTDPLQVDLIFRLVGDIPEGGEWPAARLDRAPLFLVADPKQSIYRFRRADIAIYHRVKVCVEKAEGRQVISIDQNFRSTPGVIDWVNGVFSKMIREVEGVQPEYVPLQAFRSEKGPRVRLIPDPLSGGGEENGANAEARRRQEAAAVAGALRALVEKKGEEIALPDGTSRPVTFGDVTVLFRYRTGYDIFEEVFREAGIPVAVDGGTGFYEQMEVAAAGAVLRAVNHPGDRLAVAAALRSPLYGFSDPELAGYLLERDGITRPAPEVAAAVSRMREWHARRGEMSARAMLEEIFRETHAFELFLGASNGERRVANMLKLLDMAFVYGQGSARGVAEFGAHLDENLALGRDAREPEAALEDAGRSEVRFLTMHAAKGLEFPVVVLADLSAPPPKHSINWIADRIGRRVDVAVGPKSPKDRRVMTTEFLESESREKDIQREELKRLLYVAATRARDFLFVPLFNSDGRGELWSLFEEAGLDPEGLKRGEGGAAEIFHEPLLMAKAEESFFRIPDAVFSEASPSATAALRLRDSFSGRLDEMKRGFRDGGAMPPLAASGLSDSDAGDDPGERHALSSFEREKGAGGVEFGRLVHDLLAGLEPFSLGKLNALSADAEAWALSHGLGAREAEAAVAMIRPAFERPLFRRAEAAPRRWHEFPFFLSVAGRLLRGFADLVFEEEGGLVVADFKTDAIGESDIPARTEHYSLQGGAYALGLEEATAMKVREVVFSYLRPGAEISLTVDKALRERVLLAVHKPA
ncbi:MAG: UvrD-helicase domain-containing protein [bacterium]|nr:UvrD-helicase domain-containing protein [bacterium]